MSGFEDVDVGLVVTIGTLRALLKTLRINGRQWWIASDPRDAWEDGTVVLGYGEKHCTDPLNKMFFRIPVVQGLSNDEPDRLLVLFDASAISCEGRGFCLANGRFVDESPMDFDDFFSPIKNALWEYLRAENRQR